MQERAVPTVARVPYLVCIFLRCSIKPSVSSLAFIIMITLALLLMNLAVFI